MKKTCAKLQLKKSTLRLLQDGALAGVHGGGDGDRQPPHMPTNQVVVCSYSCNCPPNHPPKP